MFRPDPWSNHPQMDNLRDWSAFGNVAGNRFNINNYGPYHREPRGSTFASPGPRFFDFSQLFNITNNVGAVPVHSAQQPGRLRNRITVVLPDGSRVLLDRDILHEHLPRTRNFMQHGYFGLPEFLRGYDHGIMDNIIDPRGFNEAFSRAATFVFRHLENLSRSHASSPYGRGGETPDLFARPRFLLANARDRAATVHEIFWHVFVLCCVLDQDRALGCSDMLARPIAEFLIEFMPSVEAFLPPQAMQMLFLGYARIFRESRFELEVLREMWELMDVANQHAMRNLIGPQLAANGMGNNAQRIWTALRHLGLV
ncbi:hypothetical protein LY78DRAFT_682783 [Colletotrichum sublineola]|uniref:Uncharacterized protein n=1 Tax=Colletotrichum sublineola TaxID=1173701 RepID=A0A066X4J4_COLSU|nr:hypothetical protein LY78DRAFT_682783 [Colletotrichum sublineola]KDN62594.1 hypothetical protein CSUB01_05482 [Colletotrichum sublineola]